MCEKIHRGFADLITEPPADPRREVSRLGRRHREILLAADAGHLDSQLRVGGHRNNSDGQRQAHWSESHITPTS
jgi:hypothetical protein